ncbi:hypothetical protein ACWIGI_13130 [Nocardia sp. NPDC055321]
MLGLLTNTQIQQHTTFASGKTVTTTAVGAPDGNVFIGIIERPVPAPPKSSQNKIPANPQAQATRDWGAEMWNLALSASRFQNDLSGGGGWSRFTDSWSKVGRSIADFATWSSSDPQTRGDALVELGSAVIRLDDLKEHGPEYWQTKLELDLAAGVILDGVFGAFARGATAAAGVADDAAVQAGKGARTAADEVAAPQVSRGAGQQTVDNRAKVVESEQPAVAIHHDPPVTGEVRLGGADLPEGRQPGVPAREADTPAPGHLTEGAKPGNKPPGSYVEEDLTNTRTVHSIDPEEDFAGSSGTRVQSDTRAEFGLSEGNGNTIPSRGTNDPDDVVEAAAARAAARARLLANADNRLQKAGVDPDDIYGSLPADHAGRDRVANVVVNNPFSKKAPGMDSRAYQFALNHGGRGNPWRFANAYEYYKTKFGESIDRFDPKLYPNQSKYAVITRQFDDSAVAADLARDVEDVIATGRGSISVDPKLKGDDLAEAVQKAENLGFGDSVAAAYHAPKHIDEVPIAEQVGKSVIKAYQDSAAKTVHAGRLVSYEAKADGTQRLVYHRDISGEEGVSVTEAIVIVDATGAVRIATYGSPKAVQPR